MNLRVLFCSLAFILLLSVSVNSNPIEVNENNWESLLATDEWMVEFFAPWCPACQRFESTWKAFSQKSKELNIKVGAADVNTNPILSGLFSVTGLPTVYHIKNGQYRVYNGNRELENLVDFIKNKEWEKIEPSSSWLTPNSFLIKSLSLVFKLTIYFKDIYTNLTEKQQFPVWLVLTMFVVATILLGLFLGIVLVLIIDCVCPPKKYSKEDREFKMSDIGDESDLKGKDEDIDVADSPQKDDKSPKKRNAKTKKDN